MNQLANDLVILQQHWQTVLVILGILTSLTSTAITAATPYPRAESILHTLFGLFSWAQHQDVRGWSFPGLPLKAPIAAGPNLVGGGAVK